ncbi:hypothetical protein J6590_091293, partial [Homalodisca vitripennis]
MADIQKIYRFRKTPQPFNWNKEQNKRAEQGPKLAESGRFRSRFTKTDHPGALTCQLKVDV